MKRKPKPLATRNPFVVLAMKRKAGSHRKPNKAIRRAEKVNTSWGCSSEAEHSAFNRQARVRFPSSPPKHCRKRLIHLSFSRMFCPGGEMAAALVFNASASAIGRVDLGPTWGSNFSHAQVAKRSKASDCKSDRETSREFNPRPVLHFFSFHASVAHLDRAPGYEPGGGKFESFQTHHFSVQANRVYAAGC